jgi:hypothetical protein
MILADGLGLLAHPNAACQGQLPEGQWCPTMAIRDVDLDAPSSALHPEIRPHCRPTGIACTVPPERRSRPFHDCQLPLTACGARMKQVWPFICTRPEHSGPV